MRWRPGRAARRFSRAIAGTESGLRARRGADRQFPAIFRFSAGIFDFPANFRFPGISGRLRCLTMGHKCLIVGHAKRLSRMAFSAGAKRGNFRVRFWDISVSSCRRFRGEAVIEFPYRVFASPSLRQSRQSRHSFCCARRRLEPRRIRAFLLIYPNHRRQPKGPFRGLFCLSRPSFSEATEPRPFWYGCEKLVNSMG